MILQAFFGFGLAWLLYNATSLMLNIRRARTMNVPIVVVPISPTNVLWIIVEPLFFRVLDALPLPRGNFSRYGRRGWHFYEKASSHMELGDAWALVTTRETFLHICDPEAINDVFARRRDFIRPVQFYKMLDVCGPNVATVGVMEWQRHRNIIATLFHGNINKVVWSETLNQASEMLHAWNRSGRAGTTGFLKDLRSLSLNILATAGFRKSYRFRTSTDAVVDEIRSYRKCLEIVLDNALLMMLLPPNLLSMFFIPKSLARIGQATTKLKQYMISAFNEERQLFDTGKPGAGNFMSSLVRALQNEQRQSMKGSGTKGLAMSEVLGNIFFINFAGHDTNVNTMAYGILLLAAHPEVQEWLGKEIEEVVQDSSSKTWDYGQIFPRLKRCQAVVLETLRLYPPIMALPKYTDQRPQTLRVGKKVIVVGPGTMVVPSLLAMHTHPKYWSPDPLIWRPSRWISSKVANPNSSPSETTPPTSLENEELFTPAKGTYIPWSEGPQHCPGKQFAQVEFVAVLARLFRTHRVQPFSRKGESPATVRRRLLGVCEDSEQRLLLQMRNPDRVRLIWSGR